VRSAYVPTTLAFIVAAAAGAATPLLIPDRAVAQGLAAGVATPMALRAARSLENAAFGVPAEVRDDMRATVSFTHARGVLLCVSSVLRSLDARLWS